MNIITVTAMHARHKVVDVFAKNVHTPVVCAVSTEKDYKYAKDKGWEVVKIQNDPLGRKWNAALRHAQGFKPDAILAMGSDDVMDKKTFDQIQKDISEYSFLGFSDIYIHDFHKDKMYYWPGYAAYNQFRYRAGEPAGAGRVFRKDILDACGWELWEKAVNAGLDGNSWKMVQGYKHKVYNCKQDGMFLCDIKDGNGITDIKWFKNYTADINLKRRVKW